MFHLNSHPEQENRKHITLVVVSNISQYIFTPTYLGRWSHLTNTFFQVGKKPQTSHLQLWIFDFLGRTSFRNLTDSSYISHLGFGTSPKYWEVAGAHAGENWGIFVVRRFFANRMTTRFTHKNMVIHGKVRIIFHWNDGSFLVCKLNFRQFEGFGLFEIATKTGFPPAVLDFSQLSAGCLSQDAWHKKGCHEELSSNPNPGFLMYMGVSKNSDIPKSSIFIGFSIINHPFWGTTILGNPRIWDEILPSWIITSQ